MSILCNLLGHQVRFLLSDEIANWVSEQHWAWPSMISYCPRCGMIYKNADPAQRTAPWFNPKEEQK